MAIIWLNVEVSPGSDVHDAINEGLRLARMLDVDVFIPFNGVDVACYRKSNVRDTFARWETDMARKITEEHA